MTPSDHVMQRPSEPLFKVICQEQDEHGMYIDKARSGLTSGSGARTFIEDIMFDYHSSCWCGKCECI